MSIPPLYLGGKTFTIAKLYLISLLPIFDPATHRHDNVMRIIRRKLRIPKAKIIRAAANEWKKSISASKLFC